MELLTVNQALKVLPFSREWFYRKLKNRSLPSYREGRKIMVCLPEILEAMRQPVKGEVINGGRK